MLFRVQVPEPSLKTSVKPCTTAALVAPLLKWPLEAGGEQEIAVHHAVAVAGQGQVRVAVAVDRHGVRVDAGHVVVIGGYWRVPLKVTLAGPEASMAPPPIARVMMRLVDVAVACRPGRRC